MSLHRLGGLHPDFRKDVLALLRAAKREELNARITSGFRSEQQQHRLAVSGNSYFPLAPPGLSLHQYGLEVDIVSDDNAALGLLWGRMGHHWGGTRDWIAFAV